MRILFIYDSSIVPENIDISFLGNEDIAYLFPLTSRSSYTIAIADRIKGKGS